MMIGWHAVVVILKSYKLSLLWCMQHEVQRKLLLRARQTE